MRILVVRREDEPAAAVGVDLYHQLQEICRRPTCFERETAADLWTDEPRMLAFHLDGSSDVSSRRTQFIERSAAWIIARFGLARGEALADFGCGPGLYTTRLAASGADVRESTSRRARSDTRESCHTGSG